MKCIVKVANAAQIGERTTRHAFKMMNELLRRKTASAGKDQMGLVHQYCISPAKRQENVNLKR